MLQAAVSGVLAGGVYAILGLCVVVLYRVVGVLNFAQAAFGAIGAFVTVDLADHMPLLPAVLIGVLVGAVLGGLVGGVMARWFDQASAEVRSTVAIGILVTVVNAGFRVFGDSPRRAPDIAPDVSLHVAGVTLTGAAMTAIVGSVVIAAAVSAVLTRTELGFKLRALAERPRTAELLGIRAPRLTVVLWAVMGAVSVLAILIVAPARTLDLLTLSLLVVPAMAAGLIGSFRSLWWTVAGGLAIGLLEGISGDVDAIAGYRDAVPLVIVVVALVWTQRKEVWGEAR